MRILIATAIVHSLPICPCCRRPTKHPVFVTQ